ncbi:hypothetical protein GGR58DRAFT_506023 [Xylaria digitata]|nr:hypothetical protein GGR58DRAFT_506023 [Xylaria digitata]
MGPLSSKQESYQVATLADTTPKAHLQPQPVINNFIIDHTTSKRRQLAVNITITSPANLEKKKTPDAPTPSDPDSVYLPQPRHIVLQDLITELIVPTVSPILREKMARSSLVLNPQQHYHTYFNPTVSEIRHSLFPKPEDSARDMIDKTVDGMLKAWAAKCQRVITPHSREIYRSLVIDAKRDIKAVKDEILEAVEEQLEGRLQAFECLYLVLPLRRLLKPACPFRFSSTPMYIKPTTLSNILPITERSAEASMSACFTHSFKVRATSRSSHFCAHHSYVYHS